MPSHHFQDLRRSFGPICELPVRDICCCIRSKSPINIRTRECDTKPVLSTYFGKLDLSTQRSTETAASRGTRPARESASAGFQLW
jgi:hypothetical protein